MNDLESLDRLVTGELDKLYRFAYNKTRDSYRAEDITQTVILRAYSAYPRLRDKSRAAAWLWGIARNTVLQSFRQSVEIPCDEIMLIESSGVSYDTPESEYLRKCDIAGVRRAIAYLAKNYREVCVLYYLDELGYDEISERLGIPISSVKWRLNRSRCQLKEELEKMDFMEKGYRQAKRLKFSMGGYVGKWDASLGNYDNADKALESLLAQNICVDAYESAKTVSELASDLGVSADYIEDTLARLVKTQSVKQTSNRYQTMFPILDADACRDFFDGNISFAEREAGELFELIYSLGDEVAAIGFHGADRGIDRLMLMLIGFICTETDNRRFDTEKLPFTGIDKAWYILATTGDSFGGSGNDCGINSSGSMFGLREYYFYQSEISDNRFGRTDEQQAFYSAYLGEPVKDEYLISRLLESGKVEKDGEGLRVTVPVISRERGEFDRLKQVLVPVLERTDAIQKRMYERSTETVKKYIPPHISSQTEFFAGYACLPVLEYVLFGQFKKRGLPIGRSDVSWFIVK